MCSDCVFDSKKIMEDRFSAVNFMTYIFFCYVQDEPADIEGDEAIDGLDDINLQNQAGSFYRWP